MRSGHWHFVGACALTLALAFEGMLAAQDCPGCVDNNVIVDGVSGDCVGDCGNGNCGDASCAYGSGGGYGSACGPFGNCANKRNYWYLPYTERSQADLFYNFYVPNTYGAPAAAYPAPYPTPNLVGHTYVTYQPLMPHEWLYQHRRTYHQYYNNGMGMNRTTVKWQGTPVLTALKGVRNVFRLPR